MRLRHLRLRNIRSYGEGVPPIAFDEGITLFDTADIYGGRGASEEMLGKALGDQRRNVIIATKFGMPFGKGPYLRGGSRRYIVASAEGSLRRLNTDYIDLYQIHQPDPETPQQETLEALTDLVRAGKVRYIGCSNFAAWQLVESLWKSDVKNLASYVSAQNEYSLLERAVEKELVPACRQFGVGILPFFPLASGFLTGKYTRGEPPPKGTRGAGGGRVRGYLDRNDAWRALEEARKITPQLVADELQGLPKNKFHCSNLGAQALNKAIDDYLGKTKSESKKELVSKKTTRTKKNVRIISTRIPVGALTFDARAGVPRNPVFADGSAKIARSAKPATDAPTSCAIQYMIALIQAIFLPSASPSVTAGLTCVPLIAPSA